MNWKISLFLIALLLCAAAYFEFSPAVEKARAYVSLENYQTKAPCYQISIDRPWYGEINHWLLLWLALIPIIIFSFGPQTPKYVLILRSVVCIPVCGFLMWNSFEFYHDVKHQLFTVNPYFLDPLNGWRMDCVSSSTGARAFFPIFGTFKAITYTGLCEAAWFLFYKKISTPPIKPEFNFFSVVIMTISALVILFYFGLIMFAGVLFYLDK